MDRVVPHGVMDRVVPHGVMDRVVPHGVSASLGLGVQMPETGSHPSPLLICATRYT